LSIAKANRAGAVEAVRTVGWGGASVARAIDILASPRDAVIVGSNAGMAVAHLRAGVAHVVGGASAVDAEEIRGAALIGRVGQAAACRILGIVASAGVTIASARVLRRAVSGSAAGHDSEAEIDGKSHANASSPHEKKGNE